MADVKEIEALSAEGTGAVDTLLKLSLDELRLTEKERADLKVCARIIKAFGEYIHSDINDKAAVAWQRRQFGKIIDRLLR